MLCRDGGFRQRYVTVHDVWTDESFRSDDLGCFHGLPCFRAARSLFTRQIIFGKALLPGFGFPIVVLHPAPIHNDSSAELAKHGLRGDDRDLPRSVGVRQNLLMDQFILLRLGCNDLEQRSILVEQQIRVSVVQHPRTFRSKHEFLLSSVRYVECSHLELAPFECLALRRDFPLSSLVEFSGDVFIAFRCQGIRCVVPHRRQGFQDRLGRGCLGGRGLCRRGLSLLREEGRL